VIDDWPYVQKEAAELYDRFGPHSLVGFLAGINRALADPVAPLDVQDLWDAVSLAVQQTGAQGRPEISLEARVASLVTATVRREHRSFDPLLFDRWRVTRQDTDSVFSFTNSIRFVPRWGAHRYELALIVNTTDLHEALAMGKATIDGCVTSPGPRLSNPHESDDYRCDVGAPEFFVPSEESRAAVAWVFDAAKHGGVVDMDPYAIPEETMVTIRDLELRYDVEVLSPSMESSFSVARETGEISDLRHAELVPEPEDVREPEQVPDPEAGSMAPAFNMGLVLGLILFFVALYPLAGPLEPVWRWVALGVGFVLFWALGLLLVFQNHPWRATAALSLAVGLAWLARWQGAGAWLPPTLVLVGAGLGIAVGADWRELKEEL